MSTTTLERPTTVTITEAAPLTEVQADSLLTLVASTEKVARVKGSRGTSTSRGWSLAGNVD